jgi:hypothetical protein
MRGAIGRQRVTAHELPDDRELNLSQLFHNLPAIQNLFNQIQGPIVVLVGSLVTDGGILTANGVLAARQPDFIFGDFDHERGDTGTVLGVR